MQITPKLLQKESIILNQELETPEEVIIRCGQMLVAAGYVNERYIEGMIMRDKVFSTAIGNLIAIPHGEKEYRSDIISSGIVVITYPQGIDWNGKCVKLVIGIAGKGEEHLDILTNIVESLEEEEDVENLVRQANRDVIYNIFMTGKEEA